MKIKIIKERIIENIKIKNDYYQFTKIQRLVVNLDLLLLKWKRKKNETIYAMNIITVRYYECSYNFTNMGISFLHILSDK